MAVTVAPLTTVVMSSVDQDRVGTASGVNNAVARVAGVLAIAVFGIVMVQGFASSLNERLAQIPLPPHILQSLQANEMKLAGLPVPAELDGGTKARVQDAIKAAFIFGFRLVLLICAALSLASAAVALIMIQRQDQQPALAPEFVKMPGRK
jgi:preprotein translocase subunit SecG